MISAHLECKCDKNKKFYTTVNIMNNNIGFIILRHVNSELTNKYWFECYKSIRKFYPENNILIIDDDSNYEFVTNENLYKTIIIRSEYKKRGELLPYYYYLKFKIADTAVILHDSTFINKHIDFSVYKYRSLWNFKHNWDQIEDETRMIKIFNNQELLDFYQDKNEWNGFFGAMVSIKHDYLVYINNKYDISKLLDLVLNRINRCSFERVIAAILEKECKNNTFFGDLHNYMNYGEITVDNKDNYKYLPITKIWTGR